MNTTHANIQHQMHPTGALMDPDYLRNTLAPARADDEQREILIAWIAPVAVTAFSFGASLIMILVR